jgi:predicted anti-sigma-YlaC factor YlaD
VNSSHPSENKSAPNANRKRSLLHVRWFSGLIAILSLVASMIVPPIVMMRVFSQLGTEQEVEVSHLAEGIAWAVATGVIPLVVAAIAFLIWVWARWKIENLASEGA